MTIDKITELLGADAQLLLNHTSKTVSKDIIHYREQILSIVLSLAVTETHKY
jgi:hypothetical protein